MALSIVLFSLTILINNFGISDSIIAYDCNHPDAEISTIALNEVGPCQNFSNVNEVTRVKVQVMQYKQFSPVIVHQCRFLTSVHIKYCGMHSHTSETTVFEPMHPESLSPEMCRQALLTRTVTLAPGQNIQIPHWNMTLYGYYYEAGWADRFGECDGSSFQYKGTQFKNSLLQRQYSLEVQTYTAQISASRNRVQLKEGVDCITSNLQCEDDRVGTHIWSLESQICTDETVDLLFEGSGEIHRDVEYHRKVLKVNQPPFLLTTELIDEKRLCGHPVLNTPYEGLIVAVSYTSQYQFILTPSSLEVYNTRMQTFINTKLDYLQRELLSVIEASHHSLLQQICLIERSLLETKLHLIRTSKITAFELSPRTYGNLVKIAGDVAHLLKCSAVEVITRQTESCYLDLPVTYLNESMFMSSVNRILVPISEQIICNPIAPVMFKLNENWYASDPTIRPHKSPSIISPQTNKSMNFRPIRSFAIGGIYPPDAIQNLYNFMLSGTRRDAELSDVLVGLSGQKTQGSYTLTTLLTDNDLEGITMRWIDKFCYGLQVMGLVWANIIGFGVIWGLIKYIISFVLSGISLYRVFGLSYQLLSALISPLARWFLDNSLLMNKKTATDHIEVTNQDHIPLVQVVREDTGSSFQPPSSPPSVRLTDNNLYPRIH